MQSSESLAEEFKKKTPGVCVYRYLKGTGASPLRARDNICAGLYANPSYVALQKCTKSKHFSVEALLHPAHPNTAVGCVCVRMGHVTFILPILRRFREKCRVVHIV